MSRRAWNIIKNSKQFYIQTYRKVLFYLGFSLSLNLLFSIAIYYSYFSRPEPAFYATSGITAPVELTPLDQPNYTSEPLLVADEQIQNDNKVIPQ